MKRSMTGKARRILYDQREGGSDVRLVIAEKPSVARAIAAVLDARERKDGYLQGEEVMVSWCIGHLVELARADAYKEQYAKWRYEDLPILPSPWRFEVSKDKQKQFGILRSLMNASRVSKIVCATDAGREGELIFRLVYQQAGCRKPVKRLWISSMEESAIRQGFESLWEGNANDHLYHAALCRAQADWMVGINATRLFSVMNRKTLNVGRVMTPTLAMVVQRETAISSFKPQLFYHVDLACEGFKASSERLATRESAEAMRQACKEKPAVVTEVKVQEKVESPPRLYDLTTLQRDANRLLGYSAQQTLDYAQGLYEKRLITYPRTDSRYLTADMAESTAAVTAATYLCLQFLKDLPSVCDIQRVVNDGKVSDHHAIIPTRVMIPAAVEGLPAGERETLSLIGLRLACAVNEPHLYAETSVSLSCEGNCFTAKGKQEDRMGWKAVETAYLAARKVEEKIGKAKKKTQEEPEEEDNPAERDVAANSLPANIHSGQQIPVSNLTIREGRTTPPKPFTEDTLLSAMETANADEAPEMPEEMERRGLGTPATRAGIIEKLIRTELMERKGTRRVKTLFPTEKGRLLIEKLPETIRSPHLTAEWEHRLLQIERGEAQPETFITDISRYVSDMVKAHEAEASNPVEQPVNPDPVGRCPRCGHPVLEGERRFYCSQSSSQPACQFIVWKDNRFFQDKKAHLTREMMTALLQNGQVRMEHLYSPKAGRSYDATVLLDDTGGKYVNFRLQFEETGSKKRKVG